MPADAMLVFCSVPDTTIADALARRLVDGRFAACVSISAEVRSVYRWAGQIETSPEVVLAIKTTSAAYARLEKELVEQHPYEVPEIVAVPVVAGLEDYVKWIEESVSE